MLVWCVYLPTKTIAFHLPLRKCQSKVRHWVVFSAEASLALFFSFFLSSFDPFLCAAMSSSAPMNKTFSGPAKWGELMRRLHVVELYEALYGVEVLLTLSGISLLGLALRYRMRSKLHVNILRIFANSDLHLILLAPVRFVNIALILTSDDGGKRLQPTVTDSSHG